jgi:hypothetical protein
MYCDIQIATNGTEPIKNKPLPEQDWDLITSAVATVILQFELAEM